MKMNKNNRLPALWTQPPNQSLIIGAWVTNSHVCVYLCRGGTERTQSDSGLWSSRWNIINLCFSQSDYHRPPKGCRLPTLGRSTRLKRKPQGKTSLWRKTASYSQSTIQMWQYLTVSQKVWCHIRTNQANRTKILYCWQNKNQDSNTNSIYKTSLWQKHPSCYSL